MKQLFFFVTLLLIISVGFAQENKYYYWHEEEKMPLEIKPDKHFVLFDREPDKVQLSHTLKIEKEIIEDIRKFEFGASLIPYDMGNYKPKRYWTIVKSYIDEIDLSSPFVTYYAPFYYSKNGKELGLSHLFYVKLNKPADIKELEELADMHNIKILGNNRFMPLWYTLACDRNSTGNVLEMANLFYETGKFIAAQPDLMEDVLFQSVNDPFFEDQWNMNNTGQYGGFLGSDIQILDAWEITQSHPGIVIAILDQGLEMDHPDLPNIHPESFDTETGSSPSVTYGPHGVAVAGIAGAEVDNNEGIAGIAPRSQLMSISNTLSGTPHSQMTRADGINFAWENGAHIINNSWGADAQHQVISQAISNAVTQGRDGKGTIVVFSTGNDDTSSISYPSSLSNVISVGAVSMCDERKSPNSCDTESMWGSNYGTGLDVVAPGVLIPTTDRQPPSYGYNPYVPIHPRSGGTLLGEEDDYSNQNYTIWFNGTSASAPHVSGIAALILSINNTLHAHEVKYIIESTAEKIGNYTYVLGAGVHPELKWNEEMGYGRVNAYEAVKYTIENYGGWIGGEGETIVFHEDITIQSGNTLHILAGTEFINNGNLTIESGAELVFGPGVTVSTASGKNITVNGTLIAEGTSSNRITIRGTSTDPGSWHGIILDGAEGSSISHTDILHAWEALKIKDTHSAFLHNVNIEQYVYRGIDIYNSSPGIASTTLDGGQAAAAGASISLRFAGGSGGSFIGGAVKNTADGNSIVITGG